MEGDLELRNEELAFDINKMVNTLFQLRMEGVKSWKQLLSENTFLKLLDMDKPFYYHTYNACYTKIISLYIEPRTIGHNVRRNMKTNRFTNQTRQVLCCLLSTI